MGEKNVVEANRIADNHREFMEHLLQDIRAMEYMIKHGWFEIDDIKIGAEQELNLIDRRGRPASVAMEVLEKLDDAYTSELALYNLEYNLVPKLFTKDALSQLEKELTMRLKKVREVAEEISCNVVLSGIIPTARKIDTDMSNITPEERYKALCQAITKFRGGSYDIRMGGTDELRIQLDTPLLEAFNTGYQVHLQVPPANFVNQYNVAQAIAGPILACATNSPLLLGRRLWHETRIALFQQAIDTRNITSHLRDSMPRVAFGSKWLEKSILEIYREDIKRYPVILHSIFKENAMELIAQNKIPKMVALNVHNSTVYRWNRPCYGVFDNKIHLRIENRMLPAGPTIIDEVANTALWLGSLIALHNEHSNISEKMDFDSTRHNFFTAAKVGIDARFSWFGDKKYSAKALLKKELIPRAKEGLSSMGIYEKDIKKYMDVIDERIEYGQTGSVWMLNSFNILSRNISRERTVSSIVSAMVNNQIKNTPISKWKLAQADGKVYWSPSGLLVEEFMTTDIVTVQKTDILELAAELMDWNKLRYILVENDEKKLVGLLTMRVLYRHFKNIKYQNHKSVETVGDIMIKNPATISPDATIVEAVALMQKRKMGCIPVIKDGTLVGVVTEVDYMTIIGQALSYSYKKRDNES